MTSPVIDLHRTSADAVAQVLHVLYVTELHDCCDEDEYTPEECPPCSVCGHCSRRHQELFPVGRGCCSVPTCECFHLAISDDCILCSATGTVADSDDREYECPQCGGEGVVA